MSKDSTSTQLSCRAESPPSNVPPPVLPRHLPQRREQLDPREWLVLLALLTVCVMIWLGWPASGWSIGLFIAYLLCEELKKGVDPKHASDLPRSKRVVKGWLLAGSNYTLWATIGCGLVWVMQILLTFFGNDADPATIGRTELLLADCANVIRAYTTPMYTLFAFAIVIGLAIALEKFWPIGALALTRKWVGNAAAVLGAIVGFSFVGAGLANARYDRASQVLRAQIVSNLDQLAQLRREGAAYRWLNDLSVEAIAREKTPSAAWQPFFTAPTAACDRDQTAFATGYEDVSRHLTDRRAAFCDREALTERLAMSRIRRPAADGTPAPVTAWLPDLLSIATVAPVPSESSMSDPQSHAELRPGLMRIADLRQVASKVTSKLNDASAARDAVRKAAAGSVSTLLQEMLPDTAGNIFKYWSGALLDEVMRAAIAKVGRHLQFTQLADNRVVIALLSIDKSGSVILPPPDETGQAAAQGVGEYRAYLSENGRKAELSQAELTDAGAKAYAADDARDRAKVAADAAFFANMAKMREAGERARVEHPEFHGR